MYIINFIRGFIMAMADSVPGVSGGTIAFVMGFYDEFILSVDTLIYNKNIKEKIKSFRFLMKIASGWVVGLILSVLLIAEIFETNIYAISSLFIGFIIASIPILIKEESSTLLEKKYALFYTLIGMVTVYYISSGTSSSLVVLSGNSNNMYYGYFFVAGMISISAMVVPGISGSTILLILGLYAPIIYGVESFLKLDFTYFFELVSFGLGILMGAVVTIKILTICLKKFRAEMIYLVIGLMIGSIYAVSMGPTTLETPLKSMTLDTFSIVFFIIGILMIVLLEKQKR